MAMKMRLMSAKRVLTRTLSGRGREKRQWSSLRNNQIGQAKETYSMVTANRFWSQIFGDSVPKGHLAVYVGREGKKRVVIPVEFLNHPLFRELLKAVEDEFGYDHPMGGITIPCSLDYFLTLISMIEDSN